LKFPSNLLERSMLAGIEPMVCAIASPTTSAAIVAVAGLAAGNHDEASPCVRLVEDASEESGDEFTPTTTASEGSVTPRDEELGSFVAKVEDDLCQEEVAPQLSPGLFPPQTPGDAEEENTQRTEGTARDEELEQFGAKLEDEPCQEAEVAPQLGPGLFPPHSPAGDDEGGEIRRSQGATTNKDGEIGSPSDATCSNTAEVAVAVAAASADGAAVGTARDEVAARGPAGSDAATEGHSEPAEPFAREETLFFLDWDDTVLPSTWIQRRGLRLDEGSVLEPWQRQMLAEVASVASETMRLAKQRGTVVLVTNAERGWIELSCSKFLPSLMPAIEGVKLVSARTSYEGQGCSSPLDWKIAAFQEEIANVSGPEALADVSRRKNIHSLGDSIHEREALLRVVAPIRNCRSKSLKFVERPDVSQLIKQHELVVECFDRIVDFDGHLDVGLTIG